MVMPTITLLHIIQLTNHSIDWDSAQCLTYSTNYFQRLTLESWYTNLEQTPFNRCQQLPAPYKQLIHGGNETDKRTSNSPTYLFIYLFIKLRPTITHKEKKKKRQQNKTKWPGEPLQLSQLQRPP